MSDNEFTIDYTSKLIEYIEHEFKNSENYLSYLSLQTSLMSYQDAMQHQYKFLQTRAKSDPGTAGKECQEIFRKFLRDCLESEIEIIMDGRIFLGKDIESPQLDIILVKNMPLVLSRTYVPVQYVMAAFEVKLTLVNGHLKKISETAQKLRLHRRVGTAREALMSPIIYGVLALSSKLTAATRQQFPRTLPINQVECDRLINKLKNLGPPAHPAESIDLVLVADAFSLASSKTIYYSEKYPNPSFPDVELGYSFSVSSHRLPIVEGERWSFMWRSSGHNHIGAFLAGLYLLLWREWAVCGGSADLYWDFSSGMVTPIYKWDIDVLGTNFKEGWIANIEDETSLEWAWVHPQ